MAKPSDTRCRAQIINEDGEDDRCEGEIIIDPNTGDWLVWCADHQAQEELARREGGERVQRVG